ncbi:hypothetical protein CQA38_01055 [Campylobacter sp. MIT 12-5580]|uniref:UPF0323 family lipoprotein n=1 Tax=Campylobacter sp. MIT 12-5580 TaxID=2040651 RepID=UPI0010F69A98|nr:UPF0323 family lipoprotein [Campylobacter sp. MIT 12-5580]TKX30259.1 hypothetical protein CQA38_01055 [Campylobacter sp. MIT 12-5580]
MKHIKKIAKLTMIAGLSAVAAGALIACNDGGTRAEDMSQNAQQGAFVIIEEVAKGEYKIKEQFPSAETRVVLQQLDGTERVLTKAEMDALLKQEEAKIDNGTSKLTQENAQMSGGGLSLGEALLASAAGAIIGSWIGSKLFNNQNFANNQRGAFSNQSAYQRSMNSFNSQNARAGSSSRSGFFGGGSKAASSSSSSFGS